MLKTNPENERIKRQYLEHLRDGMGLSEATLDTVAKAIQRFELFTQARSFRKFHIEQAKAFRRHLMAIKSRAAGKPLSHSTLLHTLNALRSFFIWLSGRPGYKSRIGGSDAAYFRLSEKDEQIARAVRELPVPAAEQINAVLAAMQCHTEVERRDRALVAFTFLTGVRDGALPSLKIKHVDLGSQQVDLDAREVKTKFAKSFKVCFFPVGGQARQIVEDWILYLREVKLCSSEDPLFPATAVINGPNRHFEAAGLSSEHWTTATPIRKIFRNAFAVADLPYFNPHSFRKTLAQLGQQLCSGPEEFKAWSQNLGHDGVMVTYFSYGQIPHFRQAEIIRSLNEPKKAENDQRELLRSFEQFLKMQRTG